MRQHRESNESTTYYALQGRFHGNQYAKTTQLKNFPHKIKAAGNIGTESMNDSVFGVFHRI